MNAKSDSHSLTHSLTHSVTYIEFWLNPITYTLVSSKVGLSRMKSSTALDKGEGAWRVRAREHGGERVGARLRPGMRVEEGRGTCLQVSFRVSSSSESRDWI